MQYTELYTSFVESEFYKKAIDCKEEYNLGSIFKDFLKSNECTDGGATYMLVIIFLKEQNIGDRLQKFFSRESYHLCYTPIEKFIEIGFSADDIFNLVTGKKDSEYPIILRQLDKYIEYGISHDNLLKVVENSISDDIISDNEFNVDFIVESLYKIADYGVNFSLLDANCLMGILLFADDKIISCLINMGVNFSKVNQSIKNNKFINKKKELLNDLDINIEDMVLLFLYNKENIFREK